MTAHNDITGDAIQSIPTKKYQDGYDAIFRKAVDQAIEQEITDLDEQALQTIKNNQHT